LVLAPWSLYVFVILAASSLIWCASALAYCWSYGGLVPNISQYSEIDFASKCAKISDELPDTGMEVILHGLSYATSDVIEKRIKGRRIYLGSMTKNLLSQDSEDSVVFSVK